MNISEIINDAEAKGQSSWFHKNEVKLLIKSTLKELLKKKEIGNSYLGSGVIRVEEVEALIKQV